MPVVLQDPSSQEMAVIYARFSPRPKKRKNPLTGLRDLESKIEDGETLECQYEVCRRYCAMRGFYVADEFGDRFESAAKTDVFDREAGRKLESLPFGVRHIVVAKLDRLFRDVEHGLKMLRYWRKTGINVHLANQGGNSIDLGTAMGEFFLTMMLGVGRFEARQCSERTSQMMLYRQNKCRQRMTASCKMPYGTMTDPSDPTKSIQCPSEIDAMLECYFWKVKMGLTYAEAGRKLEEDGIYPRTGRWTQMRIKRYLESHEFPHHRLSELDARMNESRAFQFA